MFTLAKFEHQLDPVLAPLTGGVRGSLQGAGLCVALSGGLDSTVLLAAVAQVLRQRCDTASNLPLRALHVDHALQADSGHWARTCRETAESWGVPFEARRVEARGLPGDSPEAAARAARYAALRSLLRPGDVLLTGHHADDQLESILLQWLRGGGLKSVAGMAPLARFEPDAWHARPLLAFTRAELETWARSQALDWLEDPSNEDRRFDRNYLRHDVLPVLRARWPAVAITAGRVAGFAREAIDLEAAVAAADLAPLLRGRALDLDGLQALPRPRQRAALRAWLDRLRLPAPPVATLAAMLRDAGRASEDRIPETRWPGAVVHRYRGWLHAGCGDDEAEGKEGRWTAPATAPYAWSEGSRLELVADLGHGVARDRLPTTLVVKRRAGGESFVPAGGSHRRPLRKWLQEQGVLPWRRAQLPVLWDDGGRLVAVADLGCAAGFAAGPGEPSWRIAWHGRGFVTTADAEAFKWPEHPPIG